MDDASSVFHKRCLTLFLLVLFFMTAGGLGYRLQAAQGRLDGFGRELGPLVSGLKDKGKGGLYQKVADSRTALGFDKLSVYDAAGRLLAKVVKKGDSPGPGLTVSMRAGVRNAKGGEIAHIVAWWDAGQEALIALLMGAVAALAALFFFRPILRPKE